MEPRRALMMTSRWSKFTCPVSISKYFANNSLIVLYPDQLGEPQDAVSFSNPRGNNESQHYEKVGKWFYKWFKKN